MSEGRTVPGDVAGAIAALRPWFHNLHLPDGSQTAPDHNLGDFPAYKWREIAPWLPEDLSGWTALDLGCNAGFYSFELARRGARVAAIDMNPHYLSQARWAAGLFGLERRVAFREMQVYALAHVAGAFDLVLFMGLFYHLRYPMLGLDIVAAKVRRALVFQTLTMPGDGRPPDLPDMGFLDRDVMLDPGWPKMSFIENRLANDPTNWWAPNAPGVEAMLRSSGFRVLGRPGPEIFFCRPDPDHPSCARTWNEAEYLAATGRSRAGAPADVSELLPPPDAP